MVATRAVPGCRFRRFHRLRYRICQRRRRSGHWRLLAQIRASSRAATPPSVQQKRQGSSFAWTPRSDEPPDDCLALEWAAGFSPYAGIAAVNGNELLYACGAVGVVQSAVSHVQRHLCGHRASVRALCVHPNGREIATAGGSDVPIAGASDAWSSLAARGDEVLIWDSAAGELQAALHMRSAVVELAFSPDGEVLACLCASPPRMLPAGVPNGGVPNAGVPNGGAPARGQSPHPLRIVSLWRWRTREHVATIGAATLAEWHARGLEGPIRRVIWQRPVGGGGDRLVLMARRTLVQWTPPALGDVAVCSYARRAVRRVAACRRRAEYGDDVTGCRGELQLDCRAPPADAGAYRGPPCPLCGAGRTPVCLFGR